MNINIILIQSIIALVASMMNHEEEQFINSAERKLQALTMNKVERLPNNTLKESTGILYGLSWSPNGKILAVASWKGIQLWNVDKKRRIGLLKQPMRVFSVAFSPDGRMLAASSGQLESSSYTPKSHSRPGIVWIWNIKEKKPIHKLIGFKNTVIGVSFSPKGKKLAIGDGDNAVHIIDTSTGNRQAVLKNISNPAVFISENRIIASRKNNIIIWDIARNRLVREFLFKIGTSDLMPKPLVVSPNKNLMAATNGRELRIWSVHSGKQLIAIQSDRPEKRGIPDGFIFSATFSSDSKKILYGGLNQKFTLFDIQKNKIHSHILLGVEPDLNAYRCVSFSPNGKLLAVIAGCVFTDGPDGFPGLVVIKKHEK